MGRLKEALIRFPVLLLELLLQILLLIIFVAVALPLGLAWRFFRPHPCWKRAADSRWEAPEGARDPSSLEQAGKQY